MRELDNIPVAKNCSGYHPACHFLPISGITDCAGRRDNLDPATIFCDGFPYWTSPL